MKKLLSVGLMVVMVMGLMVNFASTGAQNITPTGTYTLEQMLQYAYEDESKAIAEYSAIIEKFDVNAPFTNILKAEERHLSFVVGLYESLGMTVPTFDASKEVVIPETLEEAYKIGVQAEIENIAMYEYFLKDANLSDEVKAVFTALANGSKSHQKAFERQVDRLAGNLTSGNGYGQNGKGNGMGQGLGQGRNGGRGQQNQVQDPENCLMINK